MGPRQFEILTWPGEVGPAADFFIPFPPTDSLSISRWGWEKSKGAGDIACPSLENRLPSGPMSPLTVASSVLRLKSESLNQLPSQSLPSGCSTADYLQHVSRYSACSYREEDQGVRVVAGDFPGSAATCRP